MQGSFTVSTDFTVPGDEDKQEQVEPQATEGEVQQDAPQEPEIPEKYRGKSVTEIVEMHMNAERELGRARNEVGTVRKLADELLGINRAHLAPKEEKPERQRLTADALFDDPDRAITSVVQAEAEEREARLNERLARSEAALALTAFEKKHPTYQETMNDDSFIAWVQQSPYRMRLAQGAVHNDFIAADELFSLYSEVKSAPQAPQGAPRNSGTEQARRDTLARPGGSAAAGVGGTSTGKKIWSRAELIEMRIKDPAKFDSLYESEILPAYAEKRVR